MGVHTLWNARKHNFSFFNFSRDIFPLRGSDFWPLLPPLTTLLRTSYLVSSLYCLFAEAAIKWGAWGMMNLYFSAINHPNGRWQSTKLPIDLE